MRHDVAPVHHQVDELPLRFRSFLENADIKPALQRAGRRHDGLETQIRKLVSPL